MAKVISISPDLSSFTTDAKFRAWGTAVNAALSASGLVQTSDTGQINWTTVSKPSAGITKAGYEIWRFNDSLQSTSPVYIRLDYGSKNIASGHGPAMWINVASGTNGAGSLSGLSALTAGGTSVINNSALAGGSNTTAGTPPIWACHGEGFMTFVHGQTTSVSVIMYQESPMIFSISRTIDPSTGAYDSRGLMVIGPWGGTGTAGYAMCGYIDYTAGSAATSLKNTGTAAISDRNIFSGNYAQVSPHYIPTSAGPRMVGGIITGYGPTSSANILPHGAVVSCQLVPGGTTRSYLLFVGSSTAGTYERAFYTMGQNGAAAVNNMNNENEMYAAGFQWE